MEARAWLAQNLAAAFLSSEWSRQDLETAALALLERDSAPRWLRDMVDEVLERTETPYPPSPETLARLILGSRGFRQAKLPKERTGGPNRPVLASPRFAPAAAFQGLGLPALPTLGALANWIGLPFAQLAWFADVEGYRAAAGQEATRHYSFHWRPRHQGDPRLLEAPKPILKDIQRQILRRILDPVPVHDAGHGFRKGRSCLTAAQLHAGEEIVLSLDLKDFFLSVPMRQLHGLFRSLGYPWAVARFLTGLCSTRTPPEILAEAPRPGGLEHRTRSLLRHAHLPQGAPSSPALANLCAWRLDCRLSGLAGSFGARYTRYADDLAFSGDRIFARRREKFLELVARICLDQGFAVNPRKTRILHQCQRQSLTGLVVNQHVNIARNDFDRLKAILHNCRRHGPGSQNREGHADFRAHLEGRVTWVECVNPRKGWRLRRLFEQIDWG